MNWTRFQTYGTSQEKAFEMLCNQLFENWCKREYGAQLIHFSVVNGEGGDGGVESFATLVNGDIIGLQAKWFLHSINSTQIRQIKNSIDTAIKVHSQIVRYIVSVPHDLASQTARKGKAEDEKWMDLISELKKAYPGVEVELWNDTRITTELQKNESGGINRFWFENAELTTDCFNFAMEKAVCSWLSTKYVPELNVPGEINETLDKFLGSYEQRNRLSVTISKVLCLSTEFEKAGKELLSVCGEKSEKLKEIIHNACEGIGELKIVCDRVHKWIDHDDLDVPNIQQSVFEINFKSIIDSINDCHLFFEYYSHIHEVITVLDKLGKVDYYRLLFDINDCFNRKNILFLGNPGTGKTQGVGAYAQKSLLNGLHFPILVQARSIASNLKWRDIIVHTLGLSSTWGEDDLWQALVSTANRHKFADCFIKSSIKITPKIFIVVDGLDESSDHDVWISRIQETSVISEKYPQIRFVFTSRPAIFSSQINIVKTIRIGAGGDTPVFKLFDSYIKEYNITANNRGWLKYAITTPLALKLFCELNADKIVEISNRYEVSMEHLWKEKIIRIEKELESKEGLPARNQYVFRSITTLAAYFVDHGFVEQNKLMTILQESLCVDSSIVQKMISHFESCGILRCYCEKGHGLSLDKYNYSPGIQGYFDYATALTLLEKYKQPQNINFGECRKVTVNTLYALSIISIQEYSYLITCNDTIANVISAQAFNELQFMALQNSNYETARRFVTQIKEIMAESANALVNIVNNLVLPLSRDTEHPLGTMLLNAFLNNFRFPAQRDILWSIPPFLYNSSGKKWEKNDDLALENEEYTLSSDDTHDGLPKIYTWALSTVNNSLRKKYREALMRWAQMNPQEYYELFLNFVDVNDPQIRSDLFSILMCLMYDGVDHELVRSVSEWICTNILSPEKIDQNRDISIRYYSIAIIKRAKMLDIISASEAKKYLPPYISAKYQIPLNKDALRGTRIRGYSAIDGDLSRYVLIDHLEFDFKPYAYRENDQFEKMIKQVAKGDLDYSEMTSEQFILSAAYAFILNMGWNELEFFYRDNKFIEGVDCSIKGSYCHATHGAQSQVMTVCEKYVWQARNTISGFLCDRLLYGTEKIQLTDYGMLDNFNIPLQEMVQVDPNNIPDNRPWHIPEPSAIILNKESGSRDDVIASVLNAPSVNWEKWIAFKNEPSKCLVVAENLLALSASSCFIGASGVESNLSINSILIDSENVPKFIGQLKNNKGLPESVFLPYHWSGGIETSCYITPKEVCWFPWKKRSDSDNAEEFSELEIQSAVDRGTYYSLEYGDVCYSLPSAPIRQLLGIIDSDGYSYWDKDHIVQSEYSISGEILYTQQKYLIVNKELLAKKLFVNNKTLVWFMEDLRYESSASREKYGEFHTEKRVNYIGYFQKDQFIVEELKKNISMSK